MAPAGTSSARPAEPPVREPLVLRTNLWRQRCAWAATARRGKGLSRPLLVYAGVKPAGAAHSIAARSDWSRGIARKRDIGDGRSSSPMCADPPYAHMGACQPTLTMSRNRRISTKTGFLCGRPASSHVQLRLELAPSAGGSLRTRPPGRHRPAALSPERAPGWLTTDLGAEVNRSRAGIRPISAKGGGGAGQCRTMPPWTTT